MSIIPASWKSAPKALPGLMMFSLLVLFTAAISIPRLLRMNMAAYEATPQALARQAELPNLQSIDRGYAKERSAPHDEAAASIHTADLRASQGTSVAADQSPAPNASAATARKLVRTGALELTVKSPADAAEQIRHMAESMVAAISKPRRSAERKMLRQPTSPSAFPQLTLKTRKPASANWPLASRAKKPTPRTSRASTSTSKRAFAISAPKRRNTSPS